MPRMPRMPRKVTRREFIGTAVGTTAVAGTGRLVAPPSAKRPNVLFILADDLGYGDLSCYGRPDYRTPVLDGFAAQGIKFVSAYAAAPVCTPTRCAYITGRYPQRLPVGLEEPLRRTSPADVGLPPDHPTVAVDRSNLANILGDLGEHGDARMQIELALESDLKQFGPDHPNVATHRSNLANILSDLIYSME